MLQDVGSWSSRRWGRAILTATVLAVVVYLIVRAWSVLLPFGLGLLLAYLVLPLIDGLQQLLQRAIARRRLARLVAIAAVYLLGLVAIAGFFTYLVPLLIRQAEELIARREMIISTARSLFSGLQALVASLPAGVQAFIQDQLQVAGTRLQGYLSGALVSGIGVLGASIGVVFGFLVIPFWLIYVLLDSERFGAGFLGLIPEGSYADVGNVGRLFDDIVLAYVRGQLLVAAIVGSLTALALALLGVDFALLLGVLTAIGDLIPTLGPILAAIPVVIVAALEEPLLALWALLALIGVQQLEGLFIGPRIVGESVRLSPALVIVLLVVAGELWGLLGLLLVVPLFAFLRDVVRYFYLRTAEPEVPPDVALGRVRQTRQTTLAS